MFKILHWLRVEELDDISVRAIYPPVATNVMLGSDDIDFIQNPLHNTLFSFFLSFFLSFYIIINFNSHIFFHIKLNK